MSRFLSRAGEQVADLAERSTDDGRFSRGRALYRKGSVSVLAIAEGSVSATVRGSQGDAYETSISTVSAPPGVRREVARGLGGGRSVDDLIDDGVDVCPREIDLVFDCDCADWDEACKHVVAVFLAFADRVDLDEAELLRWRGLDSPAPPEAGSPPAETASPGRATSQPRASNRPSSQGRVSAHSTSDPGRKVGPPDDRAARLSELQSMLGDRVVRASAVDDTSAEPSRVALEPALADFLGISAEEVDPIDLSAIAPAAPLFARPELGPLADLGPELARALAIITARL